MITVRYNEELPSQQARTSTSELLAGDPALVTLAGEAVVLEPRADEAGEVKWVASRST